MARTRRSWASASPARTSLSMAVRSPRSSAPIVFAPAVRRRIGLGDHPRSSHTDGTGGSLKLGFTDEKERAMSRYKHDDHRDDASTEAEVAPSPDGRGKSWEIPPDEGTSPRLRVQAIERTAI